jgi:hypothetical protein
MHDFSPCHSSLCGGLVPTMVRVSGWWLDVVRAFTAPLACGIVGRLDGCVPFCLLDVFVLLLWVSLSPSLTHPRSYTNRSSSTNAQHHARTPTNKIHHHDRQNGAVETRLSSHRQLRRFSEMGLQPYSPQGAHAAPRHPSTQTQRRKRRALSLRDQRPNRHQQRLRQLGQTISTDSTTPRLNPTTPIPRPTTSANPTANRTKTAGTLRPTSALRLPTRHARLARLGTGPRARAPPRRYADGLLQEEDEWVAAGAGAAGAQVCVGGGSLDAVGAGAAGGVWRGVD